MHLLIGDSNDPWCVDARDALLSRGIRAQLVANPLLHPARFSWRLQDGESIGRLEWADEIPLSNDDIRGVLIGAPAWLDPTGWEPRDLAYMRTEIHAALLAWLWSLRCPVVNRFPASVWYRPRTHVVAWHRLLREAGLPVADLLITNSEHAANDFREDLARAGMPGAIYGPLTSEANYMLADAAEWIALAGLQRTTPVCLVSPHGAAQFVCVAGDTLVREGEDADEVADLDPALRRFARAAGLAFVELVLAPTAQGTCVIDVRPQPDYAHFGTAARQRIVEGLVQLLTTPPNE